MSYTPTNWIDGETPVNAENMNKLEQAVTKNSKDIDVIFANRPGVYTLAEGETIDDAPEGTQVVIDPYNDPPVVELVATFADGTSATFALCGEAVTE